MPPDKVEGACQPPGAHAIVSGQFDFRFQPELRLTICMMDVNVRSQLFTREKVKAIATMAKDGRAHQPMLHRPGTRLNLDAARVARAVIGRP